MIEIRRDYQIHDERGEWFRSRWHFSFDHFRDGANDGERQACLSLRLTSSRDAGSTDAPQTR